MKVVGFAGFSGSGKTTLVEQLIPELRLRGLRVSVVKHAHHSFDIDHPGKDTYRHREAGAFEVVAASDKRLMLVREFEQPATLSVHHLLAELYQGVDWVLVEGFKDSDLLKIEVWRAPEPGQVAKPVRYPEDDFVVAVATDTPDLLPVPTGLPVLDLNQPAQVVQAGSMSAAARELRRWSAYPIAETAPPKRMPETASSSARRSSTRATTRPRRTSIPMPTRSRCAACRSRSRCATARS